MPLPVLFGIGLAVGEMRGEREAAEIEEPASYGCSHFPPTRFRIQSVTIYCSAGNNPILDLTGLRRAIHERDIM